MKRDVFPVKQKPDLQDICKFCTASSFCLSSWQKSNDLVPQLVLLSVYCFSSGYIIMWLCSPSALPFGWGETWLFNVSFPVSTSHHCFIQSWIHRRGSEEVPYQRSIPDFPKVQSQVINSKFAIMVYESQISFTLDTICPWYVCLYWLIGYFVGFLQYLWTSIYCSLLYIFYKSDTSRARPCLTLTLGHI